VDFIIIFFGVARGKLPTLMMQQLAIVFYV
jgi:hypothetical protein